LALADPRWLGRVCLGLRLFCRATTALFIILICALILLLVEGALSMVAGLSFRPWTYTQWPLRALLFTSGAALLAALGMQVWSIFLVTSREPGWSPASARKSAAMTRITMLFAACLAAPALVVLVFAPRRFFSIISITLTLSSVAAFAGVLFLLLRQLQHFSMRAADDGLTAWMQAQWNSGFVITPLLFVFGIGTLLFGRSAAAAILGLGALMALIAFLAWIFVTMRAITHAHIGFQRAMAAIRRPLLESPA
jgi:hypothetical protein